MTRLGINLIVLCESLLSIILLACIWWFLAATHAVLNLWGILFISSLGIVAVVSLVSGFWLIRLDERGLYSSNALGVFLIIFSFVLFIWDQRGGLPPEHAEAAGAIGLIVIAGIIPSTLGLIFLNLSKTRRRLAPSRRSAV